MAYLEKVGQLFDALFENDVAMLVEVLEKLIFIDRDEGNKRQDSNDNKQEETLRV